MKKILSIVLLAALILSLSSTALAAAEISEDDSALPEYSIQLSDGASNSDASGVLVEGNVITITEAGEYTLSGSLSNGQIRVNTDKESRVRLVLNNVSITSTDSAAIYVLSAERVVISLPDGTRNTLTSSGAYIQTDDNNVDAAVFSKDDLTMKGDGALTVSSAAGHGIVSKDDLKIKSGTLEISSKKKGLSANDTLEIEDGNIVINAGTEGMEAADVVISGGDINVTAQDDGINAAGGTADTTGTAGTTNTAESNGSAEQSRPIPEAAEGQGQMPGDFGGMGGHVSMGTPGGMGASGTMDSSMQPENGFGGRGRFGGMGGFGSMEETGSSMTISGGTIRVSAEGDGVDVNGTFLMTGGTLLIDGPTRMGNGAMDFTDGSITSGTVIATDAGGMALNFRNAESQGSILYSFSSVLPAGTQITLSDSDGRGLISFITEKSFQSVVISSPELQQGETYTLTAGSEQAEITMDTLIYGNGMGFGMMGGFGRGGFGGMNGMQPGGTQSSWDGQQPPEGMEPGNGFGGFGGRGQGRR